MHGPHRGARHRNSVKPHTAAVPGALAACAALLAAPGSAGAAPAPLRVISKAGDWQAFAGIISGQKVCGMTTKGNGRWIDIRYIEGDSKVIIQLGKDSWKVDDSVKVAVTMQLDAHKALTGQAALVHPEGGGTALQFTISSKSVVDFTKDFVGSKSLAVHFPKDSQIEDWQTDISGSQKIAQSWASCLSAMDNVE